MKSSAQVSISEEELVAYQENATASLVSALRQTIEFLYSRGDAKQKNRCNFLLNTLNRMISQADIREELELYKESFNDVIDTLRIPEVIKLHEELDTENFSAKMKLLTKQLVDCRLQQQDGQLITVYEKIQAAILEFCKQKEKTQQYLNEINEKELEDILRHRLVMIEEQLAFYEEKIAEIRLESNKEKLQMLADVAIKEIRNVAAVAKKPALEVNQRINSAKCNMTALCITKSINTQSLDNRAKAAYFDACKLAAEAATYTPGGPIVKAATYLPYLSNTVYEFATAKTDNRSWKEKMSSAWLSVKSTVKTSVSNAVTWAKNNKVAAAGIISLGVIVGIGCVWVPFVAAGIGFTLWGLSGLASIASRAVKLLSREREHTQKVNVRMSQHAQELDQLKKGEVVAVKQHIHESTSDLMTNLKEKAKKVIVPKEVVKHEKIQANKKAAVENKEVELQDFQPKPILFSTSGSKVEVNQKKVAAFDGILHRGSHH